jgi:outer membrane protein
MKTSIVCIVMLALIGSAPAEAQNAPLLSLADAVDEALAKNDRLIDDRDSVQQAELGVRLAGDAFRPKVIPNVLGSFGQTDVSSQTYRVDVAQRFTTGTEVRLATGTATAQIPALSDGTIRDLRYYNADTTLTLTQPLLRGFGRNVARRSLTSAEVQRNSATRGHTLAEQQVAIEVAAAYYAVVAQHSLVGVARQSLERVRRLRAESEAKLDAGIVSQLDVLRAQQLVAQSEIQFFDAQAAVEDARDRLAFLMGRDAADTFEVDRAIPAIDEAPIDAAAAVATALQQRLDLRGRAEESIDVDRQVRFARNQLLPQVDLNLALTRRETSSSLARSFGLDGFQFATFFTISMPVDRTAQQIEFQNAMLARTRSRRSVSTLERQIGDEVRAAVRQRERLLRAAAAAENSITLGRQELEVAKLRYERGLSNNLDVVSAESSLLSAESRRIQVLAEAAVERLRLRAILGVLNPRTDIDAATANPLRVAVTP